MRKVYYTLMRNRPAFLAAILCSAFLYGMAFAQQTAIKTTSLESHEGLTITARPWTDPAQYKDKFPKKSPLSSGVLAIQVAFHNDSEESVRVALNRIRLNMTISEDNKQALAALSSADAADAILNPVVKDPTSSRKKIPLPIGKGTPKIGRDKHWSELETALSNAAVPTNIVAAHSTVQGLLYFDLQGQFDLLQSSHLYVPDVQTIKGDHSLLYFEIDLSNSSAK